MSSDEELSNNSKNPGRFLGEQDDQQDRLGMRGQSSTQNPMNNGAKSITHHMNILDAIGVNLKEISQLQ